jgi:radical SAM superfamily enzyme YgiQ (UPF0313 family)
LTAAPGAGGRSKDAPQGALAGRVLADVPPPPGGGHGAAIEGVEDLIDCDHVARGVGLRLMREFLGQDPAAPIVHPILPCSEYESIFGVPIPGPTPSVLVPGLGCVNACNFCCTSHFFETAYVPFLRTGREVFEQCCRISDARRTPVFSVMDENFLKNRTRALELLAEMEKHRRWFSFYISSSAEAITAFGIENLVRLGVNMVWIGFESQNVDEFAKNSGLDAAELVRELRDRGVSVLGSAILCMEHHTPNNMGADIDFVVGLQADMMQFMLYTGMPVTRLYEDHKKRGLPTRNGTGRTSLTGGTRPSRMARRSAVWISRSGGTSRPTRAPSTGWRRRPCAATAGWRR